MCAICGSFSYQNTQTSSLAVLREMRDAMAHRGPDGSGEWMADNRRVWLGHRRLAIIDLSERGAQPMLSAEGNIAVTFNGEIYNYKALRQALEVKGHLFKSDSDTEVLIELYRNKGPDFVSELRGMFAFALWDETQGHLVVARDPYGIKPFYYSQKAGNFVFASSVKALLTDPGISRTPDPAGVAGFYVLGSVPEPWTIYYDIKALPAGTTMIIDNDGLRTPRRYHSIPDVLTQGEIAAQGRSWREENVKELHRAMHDSIKHHMVSDVPVGAFLSAGVDSGALVGLMRDLTANDIRTITLSYDDFRNQANDEAPLAESVSCRYGTSHTTRRVSAQEFNDDLPRIMAAMDQPTVDGINSWFVSKAAVEAGIKVAISGIGGDELLGGYDTFIKLPRMVSRMKRIPRIAALEGTVANVVKMAGRLGIYFHPKLSGVLRYGGNIAGAYLLGRSIFLPAQLDDVIADPEFVRDGLELLRPQETMARTIEQGPHGAFAQVAAIESCFYLRNQLLRDTDWAGMAHSLEIRTPLVDHVLLGKCARMMMRAGRPSGKAVLAGAPQKRLPDEILKRRKTGFGIPVESWMGASEYGRDLLARRSRFFSRDWARVVAKLQGISVRQVPGIRAMQQ